jgi:hypothetical protein
MNSKDIVDKLMGEWEAAKMDTPHGLPAFKEAADEIKRLRGLIREVLGASYCTDCGVIVLDEAMLKIQEEVRDESK